jgi:hypothetical protein
MTLQPVRQCASWYFVDWRTGAETFLAPVRQCSTLYRALERTGAKGRVVWGPNGRHTWK